MWRLYKGFVEATLNFGEAILGLTHDSISPNLCSCEVGCYNKEFGKLYIFLLLFCILICFLISAEDPLNYLCTGTTDIEN